MYAIKTISTKASRAKCGVSATTETRMVTPLERCCEEVIPCCTIKVRANPQVQAFQEMVSKTANPRYIKAKNTNEMSTKQLLMSRLRVLLNARFQMVFSDTSWVTSNN